MLVQMSLIVYQNGKGLIFRNYRNVQDNRINQLFSDSLHVSLKKDLFTIAFPSFDTFYFSTCLHRDLIAEVGHVK